jgi:acyl carrier protein
MESKIKEVIKKQLAVNINLIKHESSFVNDLGVDSLDMAELTMGFEDAFGINIPEEDTENIKTFGDALDYIKKHKQKNE